MQNTTYAFRTALAALLFGGTFAAVAAPASAQATDFDIEVPEIILEAPAAGGPVEDSSEIDLANVVQSAAKGVTTVQEAPAIVTVVTSEDIRERQFTNLQDIVDMVPGWSRNNVGNHTIQTATVRGQVQAVQFLHDSVSLFDPFINSAAINRVQPMELIKRVEMITGPGGVLWGSNSLLGILNVITKDAEDVDGVEVGARAGHGVGDRSNAHAYAMYGNPNLLGGKLRVFAHGSVDSYKGPGYQLPLLLFSSSIPLPNSPSTYGPLVESDQPRSLFFNLNGKVSYGKFQLRVAYPFGKYQISSGLSGTPIRSSLPNDSVCDADPTNVNCIDRGRTSRGSEAPYFDHYAVGEYRTRLANNKLGLTAKGYAIEFERGFTPLQIVSPTTTVVGGTSFRVDNTTYRVGAAVDGDYTLASTARVQFGAEAFHEWKPINTTRAIGEGNESVFDAPSNVGRLPILCPRKYNGDTGLVELLPGCPTVFAFPADRTVLGAYVNPQYRPNKKFIFDAGARVQVAPEALGLVSYPANLTFAASAVWNFQKAWFAKFNYAQGFRPPVFNNTASNGASVQIAGEPDLQVERSDAAQFEVNARVFKGKRRIRELSFRADVAYTRMSNLIQVQSGKYLNTGDRDLYSGELLAKLYVQGGHRLELSYSYLRGISSDKGALRSLPENGFYVTGVFNVIDGKLTASSGLRVVGATEDANRLIEYRDNMMDEYGNSTRRIDVLATDLTLDRLPPSAELSAAVTWKPMEKLSISGSIFNALNGSTYMSDVFYDFEPRLEYLPNRDLGIRAYVSALYTY